VEAIEKKYKLLASVLFQIEGGDMYQKGLSDCEELVALVSTLDWHKYHKVIEYIKTLEEDEPARVAEAISRMKLKHVVITAVARDDLKDGGALHFAKTIEAIRLMDPTITIEILTPDFNGKEESLQIVINAQPDIFNHNLETVERLTPLVRSRAKYRLSLAFLKHARKLSELAGMKMATKSGLMLGLGETKDEVIEVLRDWKDAGVDVVTLGQYLKPGKGYLDVVEYIHPTVFDDYKAIAQEMGFAYVASGPFVRSSYNALDFADQVRDTHESRPAMPGKRRLDLPLAVV
jgi:lipoic acid synthetase